MESRAQSVHAPASLGRLVKPHSVGLGLGVQPVKGTGRYLLARAMTSKVIVALNYSEPGSVAPYQIQLDDGRLIFTPQDIDQVIRALDPVDEE